MKENNMNKHFWGIEIIQILEKNTLLSTISKAAEEQVILAYLDQLISWYNFVI